MNIIDMCRKRAIEIGPDWSDSKLFNEAADKIEFYEKHIQMCNDLLAEHGLKDCLP